MKLYPREKKSYNAHLERRWRLDCHLLYDNGDAPWSRGYRTFVGARVAAFFHHYLFSWGGEIQLIDQWKGVNEH